MSSTRDETRETARADSLHVQNCPQLHPRSKLSKLDIADTAIAQNTQETKEANDKLSTMEEAFKTILRCISEDPERPGLVKTPSRAAKALMYFTKGYEETINGNLRVNGFSRRF